MKPTDMKATIFATMGLVGLLAGAVAFVAIVISLITRLWAPVPMTSMTPGNSIEHRETGTAVINNAKVCIINGEIACRCAEPNGR